MDSLIFLYVFILLDTIKYRYFYLNLTMNYVFLEFHDTSITINTSMVWIQLPLNQIAILSLFVMVYV
jgi:hypothetical protein